MKGHIDKAQLIFITVDPQASALLNQIESTQLRPLIKAMNSNNRYINIVVELI